MNKPLGFATGKIPYCHPESSRWFMVQYCMYGLTLSPLTAPNWWTCCLYLVCRSGTRDHSRCHMTGRHMSLGLTFFTFFAPGHVYLKNSPMRLYRISIYYLGKYSNFIGSLSAQIPREIRTLPTQSPKKISCGRGGGRHHQRSHVCLVP